VVGVSQPGIDHVGILPTEIHQLIVGSVLHDPTIVHHGNAVGPHCRGQTMRNEDGGPTLQE
jgi:hypothetical protein